MIKRILQRGVDVEVGSFDVINKRPNFKISKIIKENANASDNEIANSH